MSLAAIGAFTSIAHEVLAHRRIPPVYFVGIYLAGFFLTLLGLVFGLSLVRIMAIFAFVAYLELNTRYGDRLPNSGGFALLGKFVTREVLERLLL
jgi:hydrogenase/urease accessory protein HupE